jgi:hypothetical protein
MVALGEYAIIAQNDLQMLSGACGEYAVPIGTIFDSSWGSLNESGEVIGLKRADDAMEEEFTYISAPNFSLERRDASLADYTSANWAEHTSGHTFGVVNDAAASENSSPPPPPPVVQPPPPPAQMAQRIVINEFVSDPNTGEREWVELYNTEDIAGDLTGWVLRDGVQEIASLSGVISAKGFFAIELSGSKLNNGGDAIQLESLTRGVADRVSFGDWSDGEYGNADDNAPAPKKGNAVARLVDGYDTGVDSNDFLETTMPTKGSANRIVSPQPEDGLPLAEAEPPPPPVEAPPPVPSHVSASPSPSVVRIFSAPQPVMEEKSKEPAQKQTETKKKETKKKTPARASFEGVVSVEPGVLGAQYFYIAFPSSTISDSAGLQVYLHNKDFPELARGNRVRVAGALGTAYGEARLKMATRSDIEILAQEEEPSPIALVFSDIQSSAEGGVVEAEGEITETKRGYFFLDDSEGEIQVTIRERTGVDMTPTAGERFRVRGILHRRGGEEWEILVRDAEDIERLEESVEMIADAPKASHKGAIAIAASGTASFLLGLLARTRGAVMLAGIRNVWKKKKPLL